MVAGFVRLGQLKLPQRGYLEPSITPMMSLLLCFAMFILGGFGAFIGSNFGALESIEQLAWMYTISICFQLPIVFAYIALRKRCGSRHILPTAIVTFFVFVPAAHVLAGLAHYLFVKLGIESNSAIGHSTLATMANEPLDTYMWMVILSVTVGAGLVEEIMYRGLVLPSLTTVIGGRSMWTATMITSGIFALMHLGAAQPSALIGLFVLSIGLCWARIKSGGVLTPILIHVIFNAMNIAFVYSMDI